MAYNGTYATEDEIKRKAGANVNQTATDSDYLSDFMKQAEAVINVETGVNWKEDYQNLDDDTKDILRETATNLSAMYVISYDATAIATASSLLEYEDRLTFLYKRFRDNIRLLREIGTKKYLKGK